MTYPYLRRPGLLSESTMTCMSCGGQIDIHKACNRGIFLRCRKCQAEYDSNQYADRLDDAFYECVSNYPCDRI